MFIKAIERVRGGRPLDVPETLAKGLGVFSLAVGIVELAAPGRISRWLGVKPRRPLVRGFGARELVCGAGLVAMHRPTAFLWSRAAGDAMSLAALALALRASKRRVNIGVVLGGVAAVAALDVVCALQLGRSARNARLPVRDYSSRSGFPMGLQHAFGAAAREQRQGLNWRDLWRENQGRGGERRIELKGDGRGGSAGAGDELMV
jgi:hypothetical protein